MLSILLLVIGVESVIRDPDRVVYGNDNRLDVYNVTDSNLVRFSKGCVGFVDKTHLSGDGPYDLRNTYLHTSSSCGSLCTREPFYGQVTAPWCSGFLIGNRTVVTAGHCVVNGCSSFALLFDFKQRGIDTPPLLRQIPKENVYFCNRILGHQLTRTVDWAVIELDRPVVDRSPLPIRSTGVVQGGENLVLIGHPSGLPMKIASGATVKNPNSRLPFFTANVDAYGGNSGSMVVNSDTWEIEGVLVRGNNDYVRSGRCCVSNTCLDNLGCSGKFEEITKISHVRSYV